MSQEEIRQRLDRYIKERDTNYRDLSLAIGRKDSYIHQYIKYGLPAKLKEEDRKAIAAFLGIDEQELTDRPFGIVPAHMGGINAVAEKIGSFFTKPDEAVIDMIDATACCGDGIDNLPEKVCGHWKLPLVDFKSIVSGNPNNIKMLRVQGDSMQPTINEGDFVWVDVSNNFVGSDGIYLIKTHTGLSVKRLQSGLNNITILSDNPIYKNEIATMGEIQVVGKVVHILNSRRV